MPVSADLVEISIAREGTGGSSGYGVPSTVAGDWHVLPISSEGLAANAETTLSTLMNPNRQVTDSLLNNMTAEGNIDSEMVICEAFEILLESALANDPVDATGQVDGKDPDYMKKLIVGLEKKSFSIQKKFPDPVNQGQFLYQLVTGGVANTFGVTTSPSEAFNYSVGIMGKDFIPGVASVYAGDPVAARNTTVLRAPDTINLEFGSVQSLPPNAFDGEKIQARCFGDFSFTINNNYRGIQCIGTLGYKHVELGRCEVEISGTVHLKDNYLLDALVAQTEVSVNCRVESTTENPPGTITNFAGMFWSYFPKCKFASNAVVAGGTGTDVVNDMTLNALYESDPAFDSTVVINWGDGTPYVAPPI
jgi:hypothetical protein